MHTERVVSDRFLLALLVAGIIHAVVILGVSFEIPAPERIKKSLAVTLIRNPSPEAPKKADYLAQEHQFGSGSSEKKALPKTEPAPERGKGREPHKAPNLARVPETKLKPVLKQEKSEKTVADAEGRDPHEEPQRPQITADALDRQIAELSAEFSRTRATQARTPRMVYINSVNAHKYKAAAYEKDWQDKIERIGNLNYPDEARRRNLSGALLLSVGIKSDGTVYSVQVRHSSGHQVLDDAAVRIVQLAAPFARFPEALKNEADVLIITRTWRFFNDYRLETAP
jgi:protein TonB